MRDLLGRGHGQAERGEVRFLERRPHVHNVYKCI